jgi:hypothetical protein
MQLTKSEIARIQRASNEMRKLAADILSLLQMRGHATRSWI